MQRARIRNGELEYESHGTGEPVVFIHGAMAVAFSPLFGETSLRNYRCVTYNRRGFGGSTRSARVSVREHAQDCHELMRFLGIERAHVVGHSVGVLMALQLALDHPEQVHSLSLLETVLPSLMFAAPEVQSGVQKALPLYQASDKVGALDAFMRAFLRPDYGEAVARAFGPQAFDRLCPRWTPSSRWSFPCSRNTAASLHKMRRASSSRCS